MIGSALSGGFHCKIPTFKNDILKIEKAKNGDPLYIKFVEKFFSYVPFDYEGQESPKSFGSFAEESFAFFVKKRLGERKFSIKKDRKESSPFLKIFILNEDKPFIVDSLNCLLTKKRLKASVLLHPVIYVERDGKGSLQKILDSGREKESLVFIKIPGDFSKEAISDLEKSLNELLIQVEDTFFSWEGSLNKISSIVESIKKNESPDSHEALDFLEWLKKDNFTFLGYSDFSIPGANFSGKAGSEKIWKDNEEEIRKIIKFSLESPSDDRTILLGKLSGVSPVHRRVPIDYVLVKNINEKGEYKSGSLIFGIYSSAIYRQSIYDIPILRKKIEGVSKKANFPEKGYNSKLLKLIMESFPREAMIQIEEGDLYCVSMHVLSGVISKKPKIFLEKSGFGSLVDSLIFLPRERFSPEKHDSINKYLSEKLGGTILSDSPREAAENFLYLYSTLLIKEKKEIDLETIEEELDSLTSDWDEYFYRLLSSKNYSFGTDLSFKELKSIFPANYKNKFSPENALEDMVFLRELSRTSKTSFNLIIENQKEIILKIYSAGRISLSDILPSIENFGFKAMEEKSFQIAETGGIKESLLYVFILSGALPAEMDSLFLKKEVEEAFCKINAGLFTNDYLNRLLYASGITWRYISVLKALTGYLKQASFPYGKDYIKSVLVKHYSFGGILIELFKAKFDPVLKDRDSRIKKLKDESLVYLDKVVGASEDKVLRSFLTLLEAMVRTNYYVKNEKGESAPYISFKFRSGAIDFLPKPIPFAEIFVYSKDFEALHLRSGKVARGGIRWSDREEDYRTEVLGLMKAQVTKNPVIVPTGAKGGFFLHFGKEGIEEAEYKAKAVECYRNFLRGILDVTDNIVEGKIIHPKNVIRYDEPDPYVVVAADKGTATFSDYANQVSAEYNYWLGDAFASGGSAGYDHKKLGITARGAWISVQTHFRDLGIDVQKDSIRVVGIGDMSGDVFGNGMLLSETIKLVAAFNHRHIFIDPDPDPKISFAERKRLFDKPGSAWSDYNPKLFSVGGGVFERKSKFIILSEEAKKTLGLASPKIAPEDLIKAILKAEVDLIWNGGIGTYIKASTESHSDVGDKSNDLVRCDANEIRAKVIAEGGNLGVTQRARIEYSKCGGIINTDFIDNSAGVDCSDHEVNIKIALNGSMARGHLSLKERNLLLEKMSKEVCSLVLEDNYKQNGALAISEASPAFNVEIYRYLIKVLEEEKLLDRKEEFLPSEGELARRRIAKEGMTRPELAVLLSYGKMSLYNDLIKAKVTEDEYYEPWLLNYFPKLIGERFKKEISEHPLRKEIITTVITNKMVNMLGGAVINNIKRETDGASCDIARAFTVTTDIFGLDGLWGEVESLPVSVHKNIKIDMFGELIKITRRGSSWFVKNLESPIDVISTIKEFSASVKNLADLIPNLLVGDTKVKMHHRISRYKSAGVKTSLAKKIASLDGLVCALDVISVSKKTGALESEVAKLYFAVGEKFHIDSLRKTAEAQIDDSYWNRLSVQSLKDDLYEKQRRILINVVGKDPKSFNLNLWWKERKNFARIFLDFVEKLESGEEFNLNTVILANKKLEAFLKHIE